MTFLVFTEQLSVFSQIQLSSLCILVFFLNLIHTEVRFVPFLVGSIRCLGSKRASVHAQRSG